MEDWDYASKYVSTHLDHSTAAVNLDILYLDIAAMVRQRCCLLEIHLTTITIQALNACA